MGKLLVEPSFGLGNRLLSLVSGMQVADQHGRELYIHWNSRHKACACPLERLFDNRFPSVTAEEIRAANHVFNFLKKPRTSHRFVTKERDHPPEVGVLSCSTFWTQGHRPNPRMYLNRLVPVREVERRVTIAQAFCRIPLSSMVGVHVRHTDHKVAKKRSPVGKFIRILGEFRQRNPQTDLLLCTDNPAVEVRLRREFPDCIVTAPKRSYNRLEADAIEDALVDMLLLSKTRSIFGSFASTFSKVAAAWGQIPLVVVQ